MYKCVHYPGLRFVYTYVCMCVCTTTTYIDILHASLACKRGNNEISLWLHLQLRFWVVGGVLSVGLWAGDFLETSAY